MSESIAPAENTTGGYHCPYCDQWVRGDTFHACSGAVTPDGPDYVITFSSSEAQILAELKELNGKLAQILEILTKIWRGYR